MNFTTIRCGYSFVLALIIITLCYSCSLVKIESAQVPLSANDLNTRLLTQSYIDQAAQTVQEAADSIIASATDFDTQANAYLWKINTISALRRTGFQTAPEMALVDTWIMIHLMNEFITSEEQALLFGDHQGTAVAASQHNLDRIKNIATRLKDKKTYQHLSRFVVDYTDSHSIEDLSFNLRTAQEEFLAAQQVPDSLAVVTVGTLSEVMADFSNRLLYTTESSGKQIQWQTELILKENGLDSLKINTIADSLDIKFQRLVKVAESAPELLDEAIVKFRLEMHPLLYGFTEEIALTRVYLTEERQAIDSIIYRERLALDTMIIRERKALAEEAKVLSSQVVNDVMAHVKEMISTVLIYLIILFAVILFIPFGLGYYTGRLSKKGKP